MAVALLISGGEAAAHDLDGGGTVPTWTFDPWIVTPLLLLAVPFAIGSLALVLRAQAPRPVLLRVLAYATGWLTLALALTSPLHWLGERLFTFHMIEHEILMAVSAPMMVAARPLGPMLWGLPLQARQILTDAVTLHWMRALWAWATRGANATLLHAVAIWVWHVPAAFDAAVSSPMLHRLQHLSFFGTAVLFWWSVLWRSDRGVAAWHLFVTMMHTGILGALMALSPRVLYASKGGAVLWGMTPLEDQQLAGIVMWIPAGTVYAGAALAMVALWIMGSSRGTGDAESSSA